MRSISKLMDMSNRVALITGGSGHLGSAIGTVLAEVGATVIVLDLNEEKIDQTVHALKDKFGGDHIGLCVNLEQREQIKKVPEFIEDNFGELNVLINTAALVGTSSLKGWATKLQNQDIETWARALEVNLTAGFYLIQQCLSLMQKSKHPSVINVSSIYGIAGQKMSLYEGTDYVTPAAYAASKGGLIQLSRYLATVLSPTIRVNCISPGGILRGQDQKFIERYNEITPLGRLGSEEDFVGAALYLASDLSEYVTGQNIVVDGGWSL
ncbi:SDR family oxidoreductase [Aurantivibrio infirmus]